MFQTRDSLASWLAHFQPGVIVSLKKWMAYNITTGTHEDQPHPDKLVSDAAWKEINIFKHAELPCYMSCPYVSATSSWQSATTWQK